jgi:hypothetical protein
MHASCHGVTSHRWLAPSDDQPQLSVRLLLREPILSVKGELASESHMTKVEEADRKAHFAPVSLSIARFAVAGFNFGNDRNRRGLLFPW